MVGWLWEKKYVDHVCSSSHQHQAKEFQEYLNWNKCLKHCEQHEREGAHLESVFKLQLFESENGISSVKENETHSVFNVYS